MEEGSGGARFEGARARLRAIVSSKLGPGGYPKARAGSRAPAFAGAAIVFDSGAQSG